MPLAARAEEHVRILSGGPSSNKLLKSKKAELEKIIGATLELNIQPSDLGMVALANGLADGVIGNAPETLFPLAEKRGMSKQSIDDYQWTPISEVVIKIGVHPANPVTALTADQLKGILTGKIRNWEPITGEKKPLTVFIAKNYITTTRVILNTYGEGKDSVVRYVLNKDGLLKALQSDTGGLSFFTERDSLGDFTPKFILSEVSHKTGLLMRKKQPPAAQKLFDYFKALPPNQQK
jgi:phosphate transport system substrate-binding protein